MITVRTIGFVMQDLERSFMERMEATVAALETDLLVEWRKRIISKLGYPVGWGGPGRGAENARGSLEYLKGISVQKTGPLELTLRINNETGAMLEAGAPPRTNVVKSAKGWIRFPMVKHGQFQGWKTFSPLKRTWRDFPGIKGAHIIPDLWTVFKDRTIDAAHDWAKRAVKPPPERITERIAKVRR